MNRSGISGIIGGKEEISFKCKAPSTSVEQHALIDTEHSTFALHGLWLNPESYNWSEQAAEYLERFTSSIEKFNTIDGPVQAFNYDKKTKRLLLHTDFARQHPVFYYHDEHFFAFAPQIEQLIELLKQEDINPEVSAEGAAMLLSYASIPGEKTLMNGVKKLMPGSSLVFENSKVLTADRNSLNTVKRDVNNIDEAIDLLQAEFSKSTKQMCNTNAYHNRTQLNLLSGGIDSRMVFFETKNHSSDIQTLCFSVKNYVDHSISKQIAEDYNATYHFHDLKDGGYMLNTTSALQYDGTISYLASSHHRDVIDSLEIENLGVIAGGAIGNGVLSEEFYIHNSTKEATLNSATTNNEFRKYCTIASDEAWLAYPDSGVFTLINRGFLYTNSGSYSTYPHGVLHSPFTSQGFVKVALRLHPELLRNHQLYLEWMKRQYPDATKYIWERYRSKPIQGLGFKASKLKMKVISKFIYPLTNQKGASMSPVQNWYNNSPEIQNKYNSIFNLHKHLLADHLPNLAPTIISSFPTMNITNKASVLTLLISLNSYLD